jgi:hypothetical protein
MEAEWIDDLRVMVGGLYRYAVPSPADVLLPGVVLAAGEVVRVLAGPPQWSSPHQPFVRIADREAGAGLGLVCLASLQPV